MGFGRAKVVKNRLDLPAAIWEYKIGEDKRSELMKSGIKKSEKEI